MRPTALRRSLPCFRPCARRAASAVLALLMAGALGCQRPVERVVLITIDTLRADFVGCYGASSVRTPSLDALAASGVRFETAIAPTPLTLPSHTSLMTGLTPPAHAVRNNARFRLSTEVTTLAERMRESGYATAAFVGAVVLQRRFGLDQGFETYGDHMGTQLRHEANSFAERPADAVIDEALGWLRTAGERFFVWVHLFDPHATYAPPPAYAGRSRDELYAGEISFADAQLGRLLAAVRERGPDDELLVVVTSDHGESLDEHGEETHGLGIYDATQRVPLLMSGAGLPHGRVVTQQVSLSDVAPTILALAEVEALSDTSGSSLLPLVRADMGEETAVYLETLSTALDWGWSPLFGLRTGRFKLIRAPRPELYDLREDPGETRNLYALLPEVAADLERELDARMGRRAEPDSVELSVSDADRLASLGYADSTPTREPSAVDEVEGANPRDKMEVVRIWKEALSLLSQDRPQQALALLTPYASSSPVIGMVRATAALRALDLVTAEAAASEVLRARPKDPGALLLLGDVFFVQDLPLHAQRHFERALELAPGTPEPLMSLGRVAERVGERRRASDYYSQALAVDPGALEARWRMAALCLEEGRIQDAESLLDGLPVGELLRPPAAVRLAQAHYAAGDHEAELECLRRAARANPESTPLLELYAAAVRRVGSSGGEIGLREARHAVDLSRWVLARAGTTARPFALDLLRVAQAILDRDT